MEIKTKYNVRQKVFFLEDGEPVQGIITEIRDVTEEVKTFSEFDYVYILDQGNKKYVNCKFESELFATKEDLINSL